MMFLWSCETEQSLARSRQKAAEKGLLKAVVFKGMQPEKMNLMERMQYYRVPGVSLAVIDKLRVEWTMGYGFRRAGENNSITPETVFQAASLSQPVAGQTALHYVRTGKFQLNTGVNRLLRSWKLWEGDNINQREVTLFDLLTHTAGLVEWTFNGYSPDEEIPSSEQILEGLKPANSPCLRIVYSPGSEVRISELGFFLLQRLLEDVLDKPFADAASESVLKPLAMKRSAFSAVLPEALAGNAAVGHLRDGEPVKGGYNRYPELAAAGLWSTPNDMAVFVIDIMKTALGESDHVISPEAARAMLTPHVGNRGLAFKVEDEGDDLYFTIRGRNHGFECVLVAYPVRRQGVVIMTNSDNGSYLIDEILRGVSAVYEWPHFQQEVKTLYRLDPSIYKQYVGRYEINPEYILDVKFEDYYLVIQPTGQAPTKFYVENPSMFFSTDPLIRIRFTRDETGRVNGLMLYQRDFSMKGRKIN